MWPDRSASCCLSSFFTRSPAFPQALGRAFSLFPEREMHHAGARTNDLTRATAISPPDLSPTFVSYILLFPLFPLFFLLFLCFSLFPPRKQVSGARGTGVPVPGTTAKNTSSTPDSCLVPPPPSLPSQTPGRRARLPEPALTEDELEADHPLSSPRSSAYVRSLEDKLEYHRKVIRLYQNLSSLAIQVQPEPRRTRGEGGQDEDGDGEVSP